MTWPPVTAFTRVFENAGGSRVGTTLLRITGQRVMLSGAGRDAIALSLPEDRRLARITGTDALSSWTVSAVACGPTDLRASHLAIVDEYGRVDKRVRSADTKGAPCQ